MKCFFKSIAPWWQVAVQVVNPALDLLVKDRKSRQTKKSTSNIFLAKVTLMYDQVCVFLKGLVLDNLLMLCQLPYTVKKTRNFTDVYFTLKNKGILPFFTDFF